MSKPSISIRGGKKPPKIRKKWTFKRATKSVKLRHPKSKPSPRQQVAIALLVMGRCDAAAGEAAGVCRQTISEWKNNDPDFIRELNVARNELSRETMIRFREKMETMTEDAFQGVASALKRGDSGVARWWLERSGIDEIAQRLFRQAVDPDILPEELGAILDTMAGERVDDFLWCKDPIQRLRHRDAMKAKELESLKNEYGTGDDDKGS